MESDECRVRSGGKSSGLGPAGTNLESSPRSLAGDETKRRRPGLAHGQAAGVDGLKRADAVALNAVARRCVWVEGTRGRWLWSVEAAIVCRLALLAGLVLRARCAQCAIRCRVCGTR